MISKYTLTAPVKTVFSSLCFWPNDRTQGTFPSHLQALGGLYSRTFPRTAASASSAGPQPGWFSSRDCSSKCGLPNGEGWGHSLFKPTHKTHARDLYQV